MQSYGRAVVTVNDDSEYDDDSMAFYFISRNEVLLWCHTRRPRKNNIGI